MVLDIFFLVCVENFFQECEMPNHPGNESFGKRLLPMTREVFIERSDFRIQDSKVVRLVHFLYFLLCVCVYFVLCLRCDVVIL